MPKKYECHVTIAMPEKRDFLETLGQSLGWSTSFIDGDPLLGEKRFFYFTRHSDSKASLLTDYNWLLMNWPVTGPEVLRFKIEKIVLDWRFIPQGV